MLKILQRSSNYLRKGLVNESIKRFFLSNAYKCTEVWDERLKNPVFQKIDFDNVFHQLNLCFEDKRRINVLDIDLFANAIDNPDYLPELELLLRNLREYPESALLPERTAHAVIRWYLNRTTKENILNLLSQRMEFGIFPDYYLNNILMDEYLKNKDTVSAVKIAVLQMLQEDFEHPIMKVLALHCCYNYLKSSEVWETPKEPEPNPNEEVTKVRVEFARNPYFDDHFDITDTNHLVGKTLWLLGLSSKGPVGLSSQLIGLVLYEKYDKCKALLEDVIKNNHKIHAEALQMAKEFVITRPKQPVVEKSSEGESANMESKDTTPETKASEAKEGSAIENIDENKKTVLELLKKIKKESLIEKNLLTETEELVKQAVKEHEKEDIQLQCQIYKKWEEERQAHIQKELERSEVEKLKLEIDTVKKELAAEEEELFYFDNEDELVQIAAENEEKMKNVMYYRHKIKSKNVEDVYIPPNVR